MKKNQQCDTNQMRLTYKPSSSKTNRENMCPDKKSQKFCGKRIFTRREPTNKPSVSSGLTKVLTTPLATKSRPRYRLRSCAASDALQPIFKLYEEIYWVVQA